mgnify:CR=1 FL=1
MGCRWVGFVRDDRLFVRAGRNLSGRPGCDNSPMSTLDLPLEPPAPELPAGAPLAERLRPASLADVIGQQHLLGPGKPLRAAFESGRLHSMILWGPPGVGKTTLARLLAQATGAHFIVLSAVLSGVKEIREAVEQAQALRKAGRATVLFVDEVHRFNKGQQDAFLPHVEAGLFSFIGATTENPSFEVNSALLSRATVFVLEALSDDELGQLLDRAVAELGLRCAACGYPVVLGGMGGIAYAMYRGFKKSGWL